MILTIKGRLPMVFLHRNGTGGTSLGTQAALDAPGFFLEDHCGQIPLFRLLRRYPITGFHPYGEFFISSDLVEPCHPETGFWTDINATTTQDTFGPIEDGINVALEAPHGLSDGRLSRKSQRHLFIKGSSLFDGEGGYPLTGDVL